MLSLFPTLLFLSPLAVTLLRVTVAIFCAVAAYRQFERRAMLPSGFFAISFIAHIALAILLFIGLYTQAAALVAGLSALIGLYPPEFLKPMIVFPKSTTALFVVICVALVFMGAGALAFDLPL